MLRTYVRKHGRKNARPYQCSYDEEDLQKALTEVRAGRMTAYKGAKHFKILTSTMYDRVRGNVLVKLKS